jgi:CheY-like chemotaxis protein
MPNMAAPTVASRGFTILLVEDDANHAELVFRGLGEQLPHAQVIHLRDGQAALDYLFRRGYYADPARSPLPDLILLDLRLPLVDGLSVLEEIKRSPETRRVPAVVLTTSDAPKDLQHAYASHVNSYLVKPWDWEQFSRQVQDLGLYWVGWNRHP